MPSLARLLPLAASALPIAVVALSEEPTCTGDHCGILESPSEEDSALLQVQSIWKNPCGESNEYYPKQSTQKDCEKAGLKYVGNKDAAEDASQCCVKATWTCNLGNKKHCKTDGLAEPEFLGVITWTGMQPKGNCCVPPIPATSKEKTWTMDTHSTEEQDCKEKKKISKSCTIRGFWTGDYCMTTAEVDGEYQLATCTKSKGKKCEGLDLGKVCCTCPTD